MKLGLLVILALGLGVVAAHFLLQDNGYVLVNFAGYSIETSVPVLLFLMIMVYLAVRVLARIWRAPRQLGEAAARFRANRAGNLATDGYIALAEGRLARGERLLSRGARGSSAPLLSYLAAARAAQLQGDPERRDQWLKLAYEKVPRASHAVLLAQAELQLENGEEEHALASLNRVCEENPRHVQALRLLARLHARRGDWRTLATVLARLRREKGTPHRQVEEWTVAAYRGLLAEENLDRASLDGLWREVPRALRRHPELLRARAGALVRSGAGSVAEAEIRKALKAGWDKELVRLYGELDAGDPHARLKQAESWLVERPEDPVLLLAAGRLCVRNQLWGKARSYLESSIAIRPSAAAYHELGQLMLKIGDPQSATEAFRKGLALSEPTPGLPRLARKE